MDEKKEEKTLNCLSLLKEALLMEAPTWHDQYEWQ